MKDIQSFVHERALFSICFEGSLSVPCSIQLTSFCSTLTCCTTDFQAYSYSHDIKKIYSSFTCFVIVLSLRLAADQHCASGCVSEIGNTFNWCKECARSCNPVRDWRAWSDTLIILYYKLGLARGDVDCDSTSIELGWGIEIIIMI